MCRNGVWHAQRLSGWNLHSISSVVSLVQSSARLLPHFSVAKKTGYATVLLKKTMGFHLEIKLAELDVFPALLLRLFIFTVTCNITELNKASFINKDTNDAVCK